MLKALFELVKLIIEFFKDDYDRQMEKEKIRDAKASIPKTSEESANEDVQTVQAAAVSGNTDLLMREYERLRRASLGAAISTADTGDGGENSRDPGG